MARYVLAALTIPWEAHVGSHRCRTPYHLTFSALVEVMAVQAELDSPIRHPALCPQAGASHGAIPLRGRRVVTRAPQKDGRLTMGTLCRQVREVHDPQDSQGLQVVRQLVLCAVVGEAPEVLV